jgi:nucleoside-diphosphate-sugar epimerase
VAAVEVDLAVDDLSAVAGSDVVVHLAGRPGVRDSWGAGRAVAERDNVLATRRLLDACLEQPERRRPRVVVASSSSVYGSAGTRPNREDDPPNPVSPYAVSKVEVERLAGLAARDGLRTVLLRYFSVYGPRQRPDMAFHRFAEAALDGRPLPVFGDGRSSRSFTHVKDVVAATLAAAAADLAPGIAVNVGHGEPVALRDAIALLTGMLGVPAEIRREAPVAGDAARTWADTERARRLLGWTAVVGLAEGLADQIAWHRTLREVRVG